MESDGELWRFGLVDHWDWTDRQRLRESEGEGVRGHVECIETNDIPTGGYVDPDGELGRGREGRGGTDGSTPPTGFDLISKVVYYIWVGGEEPFV